MIRLIKGFHDILPEQTPKWSFLVNTARKTLELFGFREIITPIMERTELFERGIGEVTDIVEKEMYTFQDRNGELVSLRPEATAGILRAVAEHALLKKEPELKLYSIGPMFRRERPSKGRFRQFFQINVEHLGDDSPLTDAEMIAAAHTLMKNIGATGLVMEVNSVGCPACRSAYREALQAFFNPYLRVLCEDCRRRYDRNPLRILDCKVERCSEIVRDAPRITGSLDAACRDHFSSVCDALEKLSIPYRREPTMVRGLDYYTRTAFEIVHEELGRSKAVGGGGRYDHLLGELGGPDVSGIGFAIGLERLAMGMNEDDPRFARSVDTYLAIVGESAQGVALALAHKLRQAGIQVEARYGAKSLKAHMKNADRVGAHRVIMLGEDELNRQEVTVRDMRTREQAQVSLDSVVSYLQGVAS